MSLLGIINLVGYSMGAALHLWMAALVAGRGRHRLNRMERVLLALVVSVGLWHAANFVVVLRDVLGVGERAGVVLVLRIADTLAVTSVTFCYSFLLSAGAMPRSLLR